MKVHEYQAKEFFAHYGLPVDSPILCRTVDECVDAYHRLGSGRVVVKAQVHTGGRGKAGGVKALPLQKKRCARWHLISLG